MIFGDPRLCSSLWQSQKVFTKQSYYDGDAGCKRNFPYYFINAFLGLYYNVFYYY